MKKAGGALLTIPLASTAAASDESADSNENNAEINTESEEILYNDDECKLVKYNDHQYSVEGDYSRKKQRQLMEDYVWSDDGGVSIQSHSSQDSESSTINETADGIERNLWSYTELWAQAENGTLTFEGEATASAYDGGWNSYGVDKISITSTLRGDSRKTVSSISASPGYSVSYDRGEATMTASNENSSTQSIYHYEGSITMQTQDCWYGAAQDDVMKFDIGSSAYYGGNIVELDVGHCWT